MFGDIINNSSGDAALFRFRTTNTWSAVQTFSVAPVFSAGFTSTGLGQCTASSQTTPGLVARSSGTISGNPPGYGGSFLAGQFIGSESATFPHTLYESCGNSAGHVIAFRQSRGTYAARTASQSGDILGQLDWGGCTSAATLVNGKAAIVANCTETWTTTANGTNLEFYTTPNTTTTRTLRLTLGATAIFAVPVITTSEFQIQGASGTTRALFFRTGSSTRWTVEANGVAESTGNVGSNFAITRFSDSQVNLGVALGINRATGVTTLGADRVILTTAYTPPSSSDPGVAGQIAWDANYLYVWNAASGANCVKRIALTTF
jgi:hypothetical protein